MISKYVQGNKLELDFYFLDITDVAYFQRSITSRISFQLEFFERNVIFFTARFIHRHILYNLEHEFGKMVILYCVNVSRKIILPLLKINVRNLFDLDLKKYRTAKRKLILQRHGWRGCLGPSYLNNSKF